MKKSLLIIGLFSLMMVLTSFTAPIETGGKNSAGGLEFQNETGGKNSTGGLEFQNETGGKNSAGGLEFQNETGGGKNSAGGLE